MRIADFGATHLVGIGGAGMSAIAVLLHARGVTVSGSDARDSATAQILVQNGIEVHVGADPQWLDGQRTVVFSTAIRDGHPMRLAARERGLQMIHRSQALAALASDARTIAVAGAHGKSTTSAMTAHILRAAGADPSFAIGALVPGATAGAYAGSGDLLVIEADESDRSFLNYHPQIAVVTNVEPDHLDVYRDQADYVAAFEQFVRQANVLVACSDDDGARVLADRYRSSGGKVVTYGRGGDVRIEREQVAKATISAHLVGEGLGAQADIEVPFPGRHMLLNAAGAWTAAVLAGIDPHQASSALASFRGTGRRFELRGEVCGVRVFDDYAHHPAEVKALLAAARATGAARVLVLFQPHLFSRTATFASEFALALEQADEVIVCDIYAAREDPNPAVTSQLITSQMSHGQYVGDKVLAAKALAEQARPGDVIFTVGAGDVTEMAAVVLAELSGE